MKSSEIKKILIKIFTNQSVSIAHAKIIADAIINAESVGAYGHGLSRIKMYCDGIKKNVLTQNRNLK